MLVKTRGIVLHTTAYNDKYAIVHIYTESFGRASYIIPRNKSKKSNLSRALFIPLSVVEMDANHLNKRDLHRIKEIKLCFQQTEVFNNPVKNVLALFLAEVLFRIVKETEPSPQLFGFLYKSISLLEITNSGIANFHIVFLLQLLNYLGIFPNSESVKDSLYFDMLNGVFTNIRPTHPHYLQQAESEVFGRLLRISFENMSLYTFSRHERVAIVNRIIEYYRLHLPDFPEIKSISVMQSLFD